MEKNQNFQKETIHTELYFLFWKQLLLFKLLSI